MRVFVTGHLGYIGVHLVALLRQGGHTVTGCDLGLFDGCAWEEFERPDIELRKDVRNVTLEDVAGHDCVIHLAAISNDPMGDVDPTLTISVNRDGSIRLAELAKQSGVERFLFSGSCSVYGKCGDRALTEDDELNPLTAYARSKIDTEEHVSTMADETFSPAFLRNATAYGYSPALRIDLVANNLLASALSYGEIRIMSDGTPWRPLVHCKDIARAFVAMLEAPRDAMHNQSVNIGGNDENYQVSDVADQVKRLLPDASVVFTGEAGPDPRDYAVNFDRLSKVLPDFKLEYSLKTGMDELFAKYKEHGFARDDFEGAQFVRLRTLVTRMELLGVEPANAG